MIINGIKDVTTISPLTKRLKLISALKEDDKDVLYCG